MSGSEDGQLRSPNEDILMSGEDEHDTDSLDIKPPQANVSYTRDSTGSRRKEKIGKEKKHSKERKHKDRSTKDRDRSKNDRNKNDIDPREQRRDEQRIEMERYHQRSSGGGSIGYEHSEKRYTKYYERPIDTSVVNRNNSSGNSSYHHQHQQYQQQQYHHHHQIQMHSQRHRQQDYYDRGPNYHGNSNEYHGSSRHQQYVKHSSSGHIDYGHHDMNVDISRDRRKYSFEQQKDAESLEQDLRSRLLSKRHKYVKGSEGNDQYEMRNDRSENERSDVRNYEDGETAVATSKSERHKLRPEKEHIIEVLDSPEMVTQSDEKQRKHKSRNKGNNSEIVEKRKTPEDPELFARRAKLLAAEREKEKRKESAREELEARRREHSKVVDILSPTAVAASVTAGLHIVKRKKHSEHEQRKRVKKTKDKENDADGVDSLEDDELDSISLGEDHANSETDASESVVESEQEYKKSKSKKKHKKKNRVSRKNSHTAIDDADQVELPESPLSIGDLKKSPKYKKRKKQKRSKQHIHLNEDHDVELEEHSSRSKHSNSVSHSRSPSRTSISRSRSHSNSRSPTRSRSRSSHGSYRSHSPHSGSDVSHSRSRSHSHSPHSRSRSRSRGRSRSRSRSEERDMKLFQRKEEEELKQNSPIKKKAQSDDEVPCDEKGVELPNYFPGIQGCRSVEEFQCLNRIEEGTYGVVYRAKDKRTNEIVALKRLKMEKEKEGFPITSLREINTLLKGQHPNIVTVREIVVGSNMDKIFIVMDYVEHDLKSLMETMKLRKQSFFPGEVKCLINQLLQAVGHLHDNWILHRDLKTSNLLLSHKGILKVGDFGLAREYGSPLKRYTSLVVTLWYRAPELLLCSQEYSTPIDIWSVGCIFAEFLQMMPLFPGKSEIDQLNRIYKELGTPNEKIWPGYKELPAVKNLLNQNTQFTEYPVSNLSKRFQDKTTETGISLLQGLLTYDPRQRLNAEKALKHHYFKELPLPIDPSMFPTWPAKSELGSRKAQASSPKPPSGGSQFKQLTRDEVISNVTTTNKKIVSGIITGNKKSATNTGFVLNAGVDQRHLSMRPGFSLKF